MQTAQPAKRGFSFISGLLTLILGAAFALPAGAQEVSRAGRTMQESVYSPLPAKKHFESAAA